jgi:drug/metabolite transporter (DMT)-like permease
LQQRVRRDLSVNAAGLVRYLYGFPIGCWLLFMYARWNGYAMPATGQNFALLCAAAGLAQVLGTNLLIMAFGYRNFVTGTAYSKTEAIQGAILAMILLGETLSALTWFGIAVGVAGVVVLSTKGGRLRISDLTQPAALCGLGAGFLFSLTAVLVKSANHAVHTPDLILGSLVTLVAVIGLQLLMQGTYVAIREPSQIAPIFKSWRVSGQVGTLAACGSACWFAGFSLAPIALVRTVGQVEVIFTLLFGRYYLKEPLKRSELIGVIIVVAGVVLALLGHQQE